MQPGTLSLVQGDNTSINVTLVQPGGGSYYNLSGCTLLFNATQSQYIPTALVTKTGSIISAVSGLAQFSFAPADTVPFNPIIPAVFNIQLIDSGNNLTTLTSGPFYVVSPF